MYLRVLRNIFYEIVADNTLSMHLERVNIMTLTPVVGLWYFILLLLQSEHES